MPRENYFILLGLDPAENDPARIEHAIKTRQQEWNRDINHPQKGTTVRGYIGQIPAIRRVMSDAVQRQAEAEEAKRLLLERQKTQYEQLDKVIQALSSKGYIWEEELEGLVRQDEFKSFSAAEIKKRVGVEIRKGGTATEVDQAKPLDNSVARKIEENLKILGKDSLYHFLDLTTGSSVEALKLATERVYQETRKAGHKDARLSATQELVGQCQSLFKDEATRKRYDATLNLQRFKELDRLIDNIGRINETIEAGQFEYLVKEGANKGVSKEETIEHIKKYARNKRWTVQLPSTGSPFEQSLVCGACGALNLPNAKACSRCGFKLEENCPRCKTINPSSARNCAQCGYSIADMPNALPLLRDAKLALAEGDFPEAEKLFSQAQLFWENHPDIIAGRQKIKEQGEKVHTSAKKIQGFIQQQNYYQARAALQELKALPGASVEAARMEPVIFSKIEAAEKCVAKAATASAHSDKEAAYMEALSLCKDCQAASAGLARTPPEAPVGLSVSLQNEAVLLQWKAPSSKVQLSSKVIRKAGAIPAHAADGEELMQGLQHTFLDTSGMPGIAYHYAVFSIRDKTPSITAAVSGSVTKTAEVKNLSATPGDKSVALHWQAPANALRIEVWVKKGALPARRGDGLLLSSVRDDGAWHNGLVNDEVYGYWVVAIFNDGLGKELPSHGRGVQAAASAPPRPVDYLNINPAEDFVEITWNEDQERVELIVSENPFALQFGESFPYAQVGTLGKTVPLHQRGLAKVRMEQHGVRYFLPITIKGSLAVAGRPNFIEHLQEVSDLKSSFEDGKLKLSWNFPPGAQQVQVSCIDPIGSAVLCRFQVNEAEYARKGLMEVPDLPSDALKIKAQVQTLLTLPDGSTQYSIGREILVKVKKTVVRFDVRKNGLSAAFSGISVKKTVFTFLLLGL